MIVFAVALGIAFALWWALTAPPAGVPIGQLRVIAYIRHSCAVPLWRRWCPVR